ncbi:unnamed protein product [Porites lobata]|uniref:Uncharacterized protein n=1 Tax=Porites lobata TaxID=104759 RepID=A0ABN8MZI1_9CNID|nr:unnamed protein product [Porites lobata]
MADEKAGETVEKELTAKQRKNRKKKEAAKRKKQEQSLKESGRAIGESEVNNDKEKVPGTEETPEEKFHRELNWCIEQLEMGLAFQKPDKKQAEVAHRHLRSLKSSKTPMPRKRQIMYSLFGDYRKKIQDDQRNQRQESAAVVSPKLSSVKQEDQKSIFVKVCQVKSTDSGRQKAPEEENDALNENWKFQKSDNSFKFNFAASAEYS